ncbi:MAG: trypsin-like peptidase domain-containing protein [Elusimicrobia bacterium]|nr:trypsin-like peptidase domain-containing protein [Elusimicrobiota bacterium]
MPLILFFILVLFVSPVSAQGLTAPSRLDHLLTLRSSLVTVTAESLSAVTPDSQRPLRRRVLTRSRSGAGVVLSSGGIIATNTHTIFGSQRVRVSLGSNDGFPARIIFISPVYDFSLLRITPPRPLSPVVWADPKTLKLGAEIVTIGHSPLLNNTISAGHITGLGSRMTAQGPSAELFEINVSHYEGDSGGPVFDRDGRFLGLISAKRTSEQKAILAIPADKIHNAYINLADTPQND